MLKVLGAAMVAALLAGCAGSSVGSGSDGATFSSSEGTPASFAASPTADNGTRIPSQLLSAAAAQRTPGSEAYRIGPFDVLDITVFKVPDLSKTVQVSENGRFSFPLVGDVQAEGRTASEIERELTRQLGGNFLRNPQVTVLVKEYNSQRVTVEGAVRKPGVFPMQGGVSLIQSIALAQGIDTSVSDGTIIVFRQVDGRQAAARFNMSDVREGRVTNPQLVAGDIVMVPSSDAKEALQNILKAAPVINAFAWL